MPCQADVPGAPRRPSAMPLRCAILRTVARCANPFLARGAGQILGGGARAKVPCEVPPLCRDIGMSFCWGNRAPCNSLLYLSAQFPGTDDAQARLIDRVGIIPMRTGGPPGPIPLNHNQGDWT